MYMNISGLISGIVLTGVGVVLIALPFLIANKISFVALIYGIPLLGVGIVILFNLKKEDKIEEIRYHKK